MTQLVLLDVGLGGNWPARAGNSYVYVAERGTSPDQFVEKVYQETPDRAITSMSILAHGNGSQVECWERMRTETSMSGFMLGQQIGDLNINMFQRLRSLFPRPKNYICNLLSCSQATNAPDYADPAGWGTSGKGLELCKQLAYCLDQYVRAADQPQRYDIKQNNLESWMGMSLVDFGEWEGNVYLFSPSGVVSRDKSIPYR